MSNVIDRLDSPPLPEDYQPKWIDFYYFDEADEPHISFVRGELEYIDLPENIAQSRLIHVQIDGAAAQIKKTYGEEDAQIIQTCTKTKLILNCPDPETAEHFRKAIGSREQIDITESQAYQTPQKIQKKVNYRYRTII